MNCYRAWLVDSRGLVWAPIITRPSQTSARAALARLYPSHALIAVAYLHPATREWHRGRIAAPVEQPIERRRAA